MYPLKFEPIYKERVWGGDKLKRYLDKRIEDGTAIGESWEICSHREGSGIVSNGIFQGKTIQDLLKEKPQQIFGEKSLDWQERFPLLIKFIDAKDNLSVQVHPDNEYALNHEKDLGKTEMWYVVEAAPEAKLVYGLKEGVSKEVFHNAIKNQILEETLREIPVKSGDVLFIPAGTIHAIGEGILVAEIQQNSDTTYRVFDWNRLGLDGEPRQLHVEKALDVIDFNDQVHPPIIKGVTLIEEGYTRSIYVTCPHFTMETLHIHTMYQGSMDGERAEIFMALEGDFHIHYGQDQTETLKKGESILLPATMGSYTLGGVGKVIRTYMADPTVVRDELIDKGVSPQDLHKIRGLQ